jgi:hypothetical protein
MCVFWNIREAFLPPVTIEELETLLDTSTDNDPDKRRPLGTRGWYDNSSDRVNFIIPALVTLLFIAIQIIVVQTALLPCHQ